MRRQLFAELDADNDGTLDAGELQVSALCWFSPQHQSQSFACACTLVVRMKALSACQQGALKKLGLPRSPEYVDQLMAQFGRNGSGKVTDPMPSD